MEDKKYNLKGYDNLFYALITGSLLSFSQVGLATTIDSSNHRSMARSNNQFIFNPRTLEWKAINGQGVVVRTGRGSGGQNYCPDIKRSCHTPTGTHYVISKKGANCRSSLYPIGKGGSPMPYCMFFSKFYAIHGSYEVPHRNASHGCIRVIPSDARWLYNNFVHIGTKVIVKSY